MKKLFLVVLLLISAGQVSSQGISINDTAIKPSAVIAGATVRVCTEAAGGTPCSPLASIYSDAALTIPKSNPFTTDSSGNYLFYATPSCYKIQISASGYSTQTFIKCTALSTIPNSILAQITEAGKVSGSSLTELTLIPAGAGDIPLANIPHGTANQLLGANAAGTQVEAKTLATGSLGNDFTIVHAANLITFHFPSSSASNRGLLTSADWSTFNNKQAALGYTAENVANKDAASGYAGLTAGTLLKDTQFPAPGASTFGGIKAKTCTGTDKISSIGTDGVPVCTADQEGSPGTGITTLNTLTATTQSFAVGTSGSDFAISSATSTHTFNLPTASGSNRGALSSADWTTFNGKQASLTGANAFTVGTGAAATVTLTGDVTGTDSVLTFGNSSVDVTTGTLKQGGTAVSLSGHAHATTDITSGIFASTYGGTGNGFTKFTGPASAEKTFTLPNASATLLYSGGMSLTSDPTANQGTTSTLLHGNASGQPTWGSVVSADLNITPTTCTNQFLTAISFAAAGTCTTATLASAQYANQGTTTTLLHGNASGNPSWSGISLTNDAVANQGTTTTVLHGNAAGQPSFGSVVSADLNITSTTCSNQVVTAISSGGVGSCTTLTSAYTSGTFTATAHNVLSATHGDSAAGSAVLGGIIYANSTPAWTQLAGNTTTTTKFLSQTGNGSISAAPSWVQPSISSLSDGASVVTASTTNTFTNKTYDAEGTGNVLTTTSKVWLPTAGCNGSTAASFWDLPGTLPAVAVCVTGTNVTKGALQFSDVEVDTAQNTWQLPADFSGNIDAKIIWTSPATSVNAKWFLATACTATDATETDDPSWNTPSTVTTAAPGTAHRLQTSSITSLTITGCAASEILHLKIWRDGSDVADTLGNTANVIAVELTVRRAQ